MLLHENCIPFFVQTVVIFHYKEKCTSSIVCFKCISIMADSDKTLIGDSHPSNKSLNTSVPISLSASSGITHPEANPTYHVAVSEPLKRKQTSFQITSVTVQGSRLSTDGGEDSADDLDESHTEDASSDLLDCSRTTEADNDLLSEDNSNANNDDLQTTAPSIPEKCKTDSIVKNDTQISTETKLPSDASTLPPVVSDKCQDESLVTPPSLPDQWQQRFRVVKIVSSEPFKRGRWLCMDFMDPPAPPIDVKQGVSESTSSNVSLPSSSLQDTSDRVAHIYEISPNDTYPGSTSVAVGPDQVQQPMYGIFLPVNNGQYPFVPGMHPGSLSVSKEASRRESSQPSVGVSNQLIQQNFPSGQPTYVDRQQVFACQQTQGLPTSQQQQMTLQQVSGIQVCPQHQSQPVMKVSTNVPIMQHQPAPAAHHSIVPTTPASQPHAVQDSKKQVHHSQGVPVSNSQNPIPHSSPSVSDGSQTPVTTSVNVQPQFHQLPTNVSVAQTSTVGTQISSSPNVAVSSTAPSTLPVKHPETVNVPSHIMVNNVDAKDSGTPPSSTTQKSLTQEALPEGTVQKSDINGEEPESAPSATNTVAIDNKIEQAMDLVKSHLMFAVREEVDVLKEKITELMDRISQLEYENGFLRANASQQTLEQLNQSQLLQQQQQQQQQVQPSSVTVNSYPQIVQQPIQQQQLNIQNQQSTS